MSDELPNITHEEASRFYRLFENDRSSVSNKELAWVRLRLYRYVEQSAERLAEAARKAE